MSGPDAATVITFGCRLNAAESRIIADHAAGCGDMVIVNTCAVTAEAERQARQAVRRARRQRPEARIVVTGCAAQIDPGAWAAMPEVDRVVGNVEKMDPATFLPANEAPVLVNDIMTVRETASHLAAGFDGRARACIQVQNGCDHRCTFCIIPFGRGNSRSAAPGPVVEQVRALVEKGWREIVLTGVDITAWGADLPGAPGLGQLVERILAGVPALERLRLTSLDCAEIDDTLLGLIAGEPRLMPHLHLSLQAGDDLVLKRMKRRHSRQQAIDFCRRVRELRPDIALGADLIAGFPTETEEMFERTLDLIDACGLVFLHVFPYSERPGTPAARMPAVPKPVRRERAARLRARGAAALRHWLAGQKGRDIGVLIEGDGRGRSEHYAAVRFESSAFARGPAGLPVGSIVPMRVTGAGDDALTAGPVPAMAAAGARRR